MSNCGTLTILLLAIQLCSVGCSLGGQQSAISDGSSPWHPFGTPKASYNKEPEEVVEEEFDPKKITDTVTLKLKYAQWMEETGNVPEAKSHYAKVLKEDSKNIDAMLGIARMELASGEVEAAAKGFRKALKVDSSSSAAYSGLGQCQSEKKQWIEAADSLAKASTGLPEDKSIRHQLAIALVHTGNIQAAQLQFTQSVGAAAGHYNTALILKDEGRLPEAEEQLVMALRKDPSLKDAERWLTELRSPNGKRAAASAAVPAAIRPQVTQATYKDFGSIGTSTIEPAVYVTEDATSPIQTLSGHSTVPGSAKK